MGMINNFDPIVAGNTATTTVSIILPKGTNASGGQITWDLLDAEGVVYSSGVTTNYSFTPVAAGVRATADANVPVPSNIPTNEAGQAYQVRFALQLPTKQPFFSFANLVVLPLAQAQQGADNLVLLYGDDGTASLVLPNQYTTVRADLYNGNIKLNTSPIAAGAATATSDGYQYQVTVSSSMFPAVSMVPYTIVWTYFNGSGQPNREIGRIFTINPSILAACEDLQTEINKARAHLGYQPVFSTFEMLTFLRLGADRFNGFGQATMYTMTNATGPTRAFWLSFSKIVALRSQFMAEGEAAFDFSGQSVSLQVDRTQYYEQLASAEENAIQEPAKQFKEIVSKRGAIHGDGNVDPTALNYGAIACVGVTLSSVSNVRPFSLPTWLGGLRSTF